MQQALSLPQGFIRKGVPAPRSPLLQADPRHGALVPEPRVPGHTHPFRQVDLALHTPSLFLLPFECGDREKESFEQQLGTQESYLYNHRVPQEKKRKRLKSTVEEKYFRAQMTKRVIVVLLLPHTLVWPTLKEAETGMLTCFTSWFLSFFRLYVFILEKERPKARAEGWRRGRENLKQTRHRAQHGV